MKTGFIGAGKVGTSLGKYFKEKGHTVSGFYSLNPNSAKKAADLTGTNYFESIEDITAVSDILFLTVFDDAIKIVWDDLKTKPLTGKIICHTSGSLSSELFEGIENLGAYGYSVHPFFAFSSNDTQGISRAFFTIEGSAKHLQDVRNLIEQLGNPVCVISKEQKAKYHAAAVFLSNHVAALAFIGGNLLKQCGFDDHFVESALKTLFLSNCEKTAENGAVEALTGPVERNDLLTIKRHLEILVDNDRKIYELLSQTLIEIAKKKHKSQNYSEMEALLASGNGAIK